MELNRFILPLNVRAVVRDLGHLTQLFGLLMAAPLAVSLFSGEYARGLLFLLLAVAAFGLGKLAAMTTQAESGLKEALVATALSYLLFALLAAAAFLPAMSIMDGFFEAISGITTTGLTVVNPATLPEALLFFRCYLQWIGGAGIVVLSLCTLIGPGRNAFQLYTSEFGEENLVGDVKATSRLVIKIYFLFTGLGFLVFVAAGMPPFDALLHVMSTVSTGGFSAYSNSLGQYQNAAIDVAASVFMLLGAVGFPTYYVLYRRGLRRAKPDPQVLYLAALVVIFFLLAAPILKVSGAGLTSAYFHVISALTTTGFSITSASEWPDAFKWLTIFLMTVGGSAGSTAGGLKIFRLILLVQVVRWMILHTLLPKEAKIPVKVGRHSIRDHQIKAAVGFAALYMLLVIVTAFGLTVEGFAPIDALFESTSALGTVGLSTGITSPALPVWVKCLLSFNMWAGRLEILPVLMVLYPQIWLKKRSRK